MNLDSSLLNLLKQRGYPLAQFARDAGIARSHLYRLLNGDSSPTLYTMTKISEALQLSLEHITQIFESSC